MSRAEFVRAVSRTDNPDVSGSARSKTSGKKGGAGIFNSVTTQTGSNDRVSEYVEMHPSDGETRALSHALGSDDRACAFLSRWNADRFKIY